MIHSKIFKKAFGVSGARSPKSAHSRAFSLEVASFAPTNKFSEAPEAVRARFFARTGRFGARTCSSEAPRDAPGLDFRHRNGRFFEVFPCHERSTNKTSDIDKTLAGAIRNALRSFRASTENVQKSIQRRFRLRLATRTALTSVLGVVPEALGASLGRLGDAFGRLLATPGPPGASPDQPWGGIWASKSRPERVWKRPRNDLGRPNRSQIDFSSILASF